MKYFRPVLFASFLFLFTAALHADDSSIHGTIADSSGQALEFVTIVLLNAKDSAFVKSAFSDELGKYAFEKVSNGDYILNATLLGYRNYYKNLSYKGTALPANISMKEDAQVLENVEITYKVPVIEKFAGKTVLNVENSIIGQGTSALELLKQAPGVVVAEGTISLQGKSNVLIMIDDRPTYLNATQVNNLLKSMPSNQISKIEVITNPSAKYDAAGNAGIINIKLKKKKNAGFHIGLDATYIQGIRPGTIEGINYNFRKNKWLVYGDYHFSLGTDRKWTLLRRGYNVPVDSTQVLEQNNTGDDDFYNHSIKFGTDYFINDKTTIGVLMNANIGHILFRNNTATEEFDAKSFFLRNSESESSNRYKYGNITSNIYTKHVFDTLGSELTANFDYVKYYIRSKDNYETHYFDINNNEYQEPFKLYNNQNSVYDIFAAKLDGTLPVNKQLYLETGIKSSLIFTDNSLEMYNFPGDIQTLDSALSNVFDYKESINAAYLTYNATLKHFSILAGVRLEHTFNKGRSADLYDGNDSTFQRTYLDFFPSAGINYMPTDKHTFSLNYNRRIDRPTYNQLNPFIFFLDPFSYHIGSPYLKPQYTHNVSVAYSFKNIFTITAAYSKTKDLISNVIRNVAGTRESYHTTINIGEVTGWNISLSVPVSVTKWWFTNTYVEVNLKKQKDIIEQIETKNMYWMLQSNNQFTLPKGFSLENNFFFQSKFIVGNITINPLFNWSAGIQYTFLKGKATIKATVTDIVYTQKVTANSKVEGLYENLFKRRNDTRGLYLTFTYNIDKNNTGEHRDRRTALEEEKNRIQNSASGN